MFSSLFHKKKINTEGVETFKTAVKAIKVFIGNEEWSKALHSIEEVELKEKKGLNTFLTQHNKNNSKEIRSIKNEFIKKNKKKFATLRALKEILTRKQQAYQNKIKAKANKDQCKKIQNEIQNLIALKKSSEALNLLQFFLSQHKQQSSIINFYNRQKRKILKNIERERKKQDYINKKNAKTEALSLIGENITFEQTQSTQKKEKYKSLWGLLQKKIALYKKTKEGINNKNLLDEINKLIKTSSESKNDIASKKLADIHEGLVKEISDSSMMGYELYGKILGADKISGDTIGFYEGKGQYNFFLGDSTGHGIKAGFIITLLNRLFNENIENNTLQTLAYKINNGLKQDLESRNFITGVFFEVNNSKRYDNESIHNNEIRFVGMGHEAMIVYRDQEQIVERVIPGGLAGGIRMIKDKSQIKVQSMKLQNNDILMVYSDGVIESRDPEGNMYGIKRLENTFNKIAAFDKNIHRIYEYIISDVQVFKGGSKFLDDASILIVKRNTDKDIQERESKYIRDLGIKEGLKREQIKSLEGKTKEEINLRIEAFKKIKETNRIIKSLENLYYTGEILRLKQEAISSIRQGYIHKKINFYLKKAIDNEKKYKIAQKNAKLKNKYNILKELKKKGDYKTVIKEIEEVITRDGNI